MKRRKIYRTCKMNKSSSVISLLKRNCKFLVRLQPMEKRDWDCIRIEPDQKTLRVKNLEECKRYDRDESEARYWEFNTNGIFANISQEELYQAIFQNPIEHILKGCDIVFIAFGQSGTGKTYTTTGPNDNMQTRGLAPRLLTELFSEIKLKTAVLDVSVYMSYIEIIGQYIYDLLTEPASFCPNQLKITKERVSSEAEAVELLFKAQTRKKMKRENDNCGTSLITLYITSISSVISQPEICNSKVHFVDMGGTNTLNNITKSFRSQLEMNKMKMDLGRFIISLISSFGKTNKGPPFRQSKLTTILKFSLTRSILRIVGHIRPTRDDLAMTISTLRFGMLFKGIHKIPLVSKPMSDRSLIIKKLEEELDQLKDEIVVRELLSGDGYGTLSQEESSHVERMALSFFEGTLSLEALLNVVKPAILLPGIKRIFQEKKKEIINQTIYYTPEIPVFQYSRKTVDTPFERKKTAVRKSTTIKKSSMERELPSPRHSSQDNSREKLRDDFLKELPHIIEELSQAKANLAKEYSKIEKQVEEYLQLLQKETDLEQQLEEARWNRLIEVGEKVCANGKPYRSPQEERLKEQLQILSQELREMKDTMNNSHCLYKNQLQMYHYHKMKSECRFQEFCMSSYAGPFNEADFENFASIEHAPEIKEIPAKKVSYSHHQATHNSKLQDRTLGPKHSHMQVEDMKKIHNKKRNTSM